MKIEINEKEYSTIMAALQIAEVETGASRFGELATVLEARMENSREVAKEDAWFDKNLKAFTEWKGDSDGSVGCD